MAVELGNRFKSVTTHGQTWVVQRLLTGPGMIPHAILTQCDDENAIRTFSFSALEDRALFEPDHDAPPPSPKPPAKGGTVRGFLRISKKAA